MVQFSSPMAVVTPTLDGPVLTALALADESFTTGQLKRVLGHGSDEGIRKVLRRLTDQGIVSATKVGPVSAYRLNRDHLDAEFILGLVSARERLIDRLQKQVETWDPSPVYAAVFGSATSGAMRPDSDIDLLLVCDNDVDLAAWEHQVAALVDAVTAWTGNDARPLVYSVDELDAAHDEPVLAEIVRTALTVAGPTLWLPDRLRRVRRKHGDAEVGAPSMGFEVFGSR